MLERVSREEAEEAEDEEWLGIEPGVNERSVEQKVKLE